MYNYLAEFTGALILVYVLLTTFNPVAIGLTYTVLVLLFSSVSNGYFNPAITIVMASINELPMSDVIPFFLAQTMGGLAGVEIYKRWKI
jgi:glycerol uptake facilitator-like aquaporin